MADLQLADCPEPEKMDIAGHPVAVSLGMAVWAEIKTDRQRVIDYFLSLLKGYIMKVCGKDKVFWREVKRAVLAGLLCLPFYSAIAESITPVTEGKMETVNLVPEGYRPLTVTEFVVDAEKNGTYILSVGVKDDTIDQDDWILTKNIKGRIVIYNPSNEQMLYNISFPGKRTLPGAAFLLSFNKSVYQGFFYYLELKKASILFILNYIS